VPAASPRATQKRRVDLARERFLAAGETDGVRPEIARSWRRARERGADPRLLRAPALVDGELASRAEADEVLWLARPLLFDLASRLDEVGHLVACVDARGCVLWAGGDPVAIAAGAEVGLAPGGLLAEDAVGTNGAGTALVDRRVVEVVASEHLAEALQRWATAGAPVVAAGGEPLGAVLVAGGWDAPERPGAALAAAAAAAISERLRARQGVRDALVRYALRSAWEAGEALVAVDRDGRVLQANELARRQLPLDGSELPWDVRERLVAPLRGVPGQPEDELAIDWPLPGGERRRVLASIESHEGRPVGALLRLARRGNGHGEGGEPGRPRPRRAARYGLESLVGASGPLRSAVGLAEVAARNDLPVVLQGESGTGKELFAHGIHAASGRAGGPFVALNCGAIPATLVEAELFGYEPGTFTGGQREGKAGKLEDAHRGTLFLDEVGELPLPAQTALLRVLQEGEVIRLGGSLPRPVNVRIVAATNRRLADEVSAGRFRQDLFFRLSVLHVGIPPLRERPGDVALLARAFLDEAAAAVGRGGLELSPGALALLEAHPWPGNVRELRNVLMRAAAVAATRTIEPGDLMLVELRPPAGPPGAYPKWQPAPVPAPAPPGALEGLDAAGGEAEGPGRDELVAALDACGWNIARTATTLKVSRMTLYRRLRKFGITR
jgi:transcriptional regulator of acetoin/glycerol metabolism